MKNDNFFKRLTSRKAIILLSIFGIGVLFALFFWSGVAEYLFHYRDNKSGSETTMITDYQNSDGQTSYSESEESALSEKEATKTTSSVSLEETESILSPTDGPIPDDTSVSTSVPTSAPTSAPTSVPTSAPTSAPTKAPTVAETTATPTDTTAPTTTESVVMGDFSGTFDATKASAVIELVNQERVAEGLSPLAQNTDLTSSAKVRAPEIVVVWSHDRPDGSSCFTAPPGMQMAENIAKGQISAEQVVAAWMGSTGHRANIMNSDYTRIGVACYYCGGTYYWVQHFS